ncbi:MAG: anti-sigma factor [Stellaceae bacterium]
MRYESPELRERLAAEYVLGTMPSLVRRRFERLMAADPALARIAGAWADRLSPLDDPTPAAAPPARVWQAVERRIGGALPAPPSPWRRWLDSLALWRGLGLAGGLATAALAIYLALLPRPIAPAVVAVLTGHGGEPGWVAVAGPKAGEVSFSAVAPRPEPRPHAFELWAIAGGPPRPLGLLPPRSGSAVALRASRLPPSGSVLAVSLEPPGGSPSGSPTGPVLYQGKVLARPF